jgi:hypothetical protein
MANRVVDFVLNSKQDPSTESETALLVVHRTPKFEVLCGEIDDTSADVERGTEGKCSSGPRVSFQGETTIFLDVNCPYVRKSVHAAIENSPCRSRHFRIVDGAGEGMEAVPLPPEADFQWSEYERIDWDSVRISYCNDSRLTIGGPFFMRF